MKDVTQEVHLLKGIVGENITVVVNELESFKRFLAVGEEITADDLKRVGQAMSMFTASVGVLTGFLMAVKEEEA